MNSEWIFNLLFILAIVAFRMVLTKKKKQPSQKEGSYQEEREEAPIKKSPSNFESLKPVKKEIPIQNRRVLHSTIENRRMETNIEQRKLESKIESFETRNLVSQELSYQEELSSSSPEPVRKRIFEDKSSLKKAILAQIILERPYQD